MTNASTALPSPPACGCRAVLGELGFSPVAGGFRLGKLLLEPVGAGWVFSAPWPKGRDPLDQLDQPGLWRFDRRGAGDRRAFALPGLALDHNGAEIRHHEPESIGDDPVSAFESVVRWVLDTARGTVPAGWEPPDDATLAEWADGGRLTIQQGGVLRQIEVARGAQRLALRVALHQSLPPGLPAARRQWLRRVLLDTQARWSLVRTGITRCGEVLAVVDLSGVPAGPDRPLFLAGAESLRQIAAPLVETVELLAASDAGDRIITLCQPF